MITQTILSVLLLSPVAADSNSAASQRPLGMTASEMAVKEREGIEALRKLGVHCNLVGSGRLIHFGMPRYTEALGDPDDILRHVRYSAKLKAVSLGGWPLTDKGLKHLAGLTSIKQLGLSGTRITDAGLVHLRGLTNVTCINLECPAITDRGLVHLAALPNLYLLRLNNTAVTDDGLVHLKGLPKLGWLELNNTRITNTGLAHLSGSTTMETLYLADTQVDDDGLFHLRNMNQLWDLNLNRTAVTDTGLGTMLEYKALRQIGHLRLEDCNVTDAGAALLGEMHLLQGLNLSGTKITNAGLQKLKPLSDLYWMTVYRTEIDAGGVKQFYEGRANQKIISYDR